LIIYREEDFDDVIEFLKNLSKTEKDYTIAIFHKTIHTNRDI